MEKRNKAVNQIKIGDFKKEKKSVGKTVSKLGKVFGYILSAILTIMLVCFVAGIIVACAFSIYVKKYIDPTIDESMLVTGTSEQTTKIYYYEFTDRKNRVGTAIELEDQRIYGIENSLWASYDEIPSYLREAFISIEDKRFNKHKGVDWRRTGGAVINFFLGFDDSYGGSTITQQLIKNITGRNEPTIQRKVQEILSALNLEKSKSKEQIIELYLNIVPLSQKCIGVRAAANTYFGKELDELTLAECASIAAITNSPTRYDPFQNPDNNIKRRNDILFEMHVQEKISDDEYNDALAEELKLRDENEEIKSATDDSKINSWYIDTVICDVRDDLMEKYGLSSSLASKLITSGGLRIYTLMDPKVQEIIESVYEDESSFPKSTGGIPAQSAMAVVDPETGDLLGVAGARGKKQGNLILNYATQTKRAPGSSLKPLSVYAPALEEGIITYGSVYDDTPLWFTSAQLPYPKNLPDVYKGLTTVNSAVERSVNTVAMKILQDLTIDTSYDYLKKRLGFDYLIDYGEDSNGNGYTDKGLAALALGQLNFGVTVRDIASAYTVFPSGGIYYSGKSYLYVYDSSGNLLLSNANDSGSIVFSEQTAYIMTKMLQNVMNNGTGKSVKLRNSMDVAGKTGTAGNDYDRWFVGYTPYYIGAVWYGYSYPKTLSNLSQNPSNTIFDLVMTKLHESIIEEANNGGKTLLSFDDNRPSDIVECTYCKDSGKLMTEACRLDPRGNRSDTGYFTVATMPTEYCDTHIIVDYDKTTNAYAHKYTLPENIVKTALIKENLRSFPVQIYVEDAQYVYRVLPDGVRPAGWWGVPYFNAVIPEGTFVGISNVNGGRQYNSFSYENYIFDAEPTTSESEKNDSIEDDAPIPSEGELNTEFED